MKIAVIGTIMYDDITTHRGERGGSLGGILYNVLALGAITRASDVVAPFCSVSEQDLRTIRQSYGKEHAQISWAHVGLSPGGTDRNVLAYASPTSRTEKMTLHTAPLGIEDLAPAMDFDAIVLNFVNGRELSLAALRELRSKFNGHIHLDVHNLGKVLGADGRLTAAPFPDWRDWFACVDTVQANEWEAELLLGKKPETEAEYRQAARELLGSAGVKAAALTIGGQGAVVMHRMAADGAVRAIRVPALPVEGVVDTTGCGDCFSAGWVVGLQRWKNPARAALLATAISSLNTLFSGLDGIHRLSDADSSAKQSFPELFDRIGTGWMGDPA